jgi:hypothetical protein
MRHTAPQADQIRRRGLMRAALAAMAILLAGCSDAHPLSGPNSPRDGAGRVVDPIYGTPIPGTPAGNGGV